MQHYQTTIKFQWHTITFLGEVYTGYGHVYSLVGCTWLKQLICYNYMISNIDFFFFTFRICKLRKSHLLRYGGHFATSIS
jgi:hypothetical protein